MKNKNKSKGFFSLEPIIAMVIFAVGLLSVVHYQTSAIQNSTNGIYRMSAVNLVDNLVGTINLDRENLANYASNSGDEYQNWLETVKDSLVLDDNYPPIIEVVEEGTGKLVNITLSWKNAGTNVISSYDTSIRLN